MTKSKTKRKEAPLPSSKSVNKFIDAHLEDFKASRKPVEKEVLSPEQELVKDRLLMDMNATFCELMRSGKRKEAKKQMGKMHRYMFDVTKNVTFGRMAENCIRYIAHTIIQRLQKEWMLNEEQVLRYTEGKFREYAFETTTESLASAMKSDSASFRGKSGIYESLALCGFLVNKVNEGTKVTLFVNLDWVFGFSLDLLSGISTDYLYTINSYTRQREDGVLISLDAEGHQHSNEPTASETKKGERETIGGKPTASETFVEGRKFSAGAAAAEAPPPEVLKMAKRAVDSLVGQIYTRQNFNNQRVQLNKHTILLNLVGTNPDDMLYLMIQNYKTLHIEGEPWADTDARIHEIIKRAAAYMQKHPHFKIYAPLMYLDVSMQSGTLKAYHERWYKEETEDGEAQSVDNQPLTAQINTTNGEKSIDVVGKIGESRPYQYDYISWFIDGQGADRQVVNRKIKKWSFETITDCIRYTKAKLGRGFKPDVTVVAYIMGVINQLGDSRVIKRHADAEELLLANGIDIATEKRQRRYEKDRSEGKTDEYYLKVTALVRNQKAKISEDLVQKIITRSRDKKAHDNQIQVWIEAAANGQLNF